jgi:peptidyl-prolyl cis-trans isomerase B (cyclophilin B)
MYVLPIIILVLAISLFYFKFFYKNQADGPQVAKEEKVKIALMETDMGNIKLELYPEAAPKTVENFVKLSEKGYYNGVVFHRVMKDFMIQGGDPSGTGMEGESAFGKDFEDEINPWSIGVSEENITAFQKSGYKYDKKLTSLKNEVGAIAMANKGANTNSSQFFIITEQAQPHLDGKHTVFGKVIEGMDVVRKIAAVEVDEYDKPKTDIKIKAITITDGTKGESGSGSTEIKTEGPVSETSSSSPVQIQAVDSDGNPVDIGSQIQIETE